MEVAARDLWQSVGGGRHVLHGVSFIAHANELVAVVGGSGAGKTTLLEALAGVRPADRGEVRFDGVDLYGNLDAFSRTLGYVPQDDIIHAELPLERTLRYSAALRLPGRDRGRRSTRWSTERSRRSTSPNVPACGSAPCRAGSASARASRWSC